MKILNITPKNYYTCQFCRNEFETTKEHQIIKDICPVCSETCQIHVNIKILDNYPNNELKLILACVLPNFKPNSRSFAIRKLARSFFLKFKEVENE